MITWKDIKLLGLTMFINLVMFLIQNIFIKVKITKSVLIVILVLSVIEGLVLDKFVVQGGVIQPR